MSAWDLPWLVYLDQPCLGVQCRKSRDLHLGECGFLQALKSHINIMHNEYVQTIYIKIHCQKLKWCSISNHINYYFQIISWNASIIVTQEKTLQSWISHISNNLYNRLYKKAKAHIKKLGDTFLFVWEAILTISLFTEK